MPIENEEGCGVAPTMLQAGIDNVRQKIANMQSSSSQTTIANMQSSLSQTTSRAQGQGMQLQMEMIRPGRHDVEHDSDQARYAAAPMSFSRHRNSVVQSEFKLQWPKTQNVGVVGGISMNARLSFEVGARAQSQTADSSQEKRLLHLSQPPNRTPRAWQKLKQQEAAELSEGRTPQTAHPDSPNRHRPGWLSARPVSGHNSGSNRAVQSARARRPPDWNASTDPFSSLPSSKTSANMGESVEFKETMEQIQQVQERRVRRELKEFRDQLFENPKRHFSKRERELFFQKIWGSDDIHQMQKICSRAMDDRSFEDCTFLCKMLSKCSFLQQNLSMPQMHSAALCMQALSLEPGQDLHVSEKIPQMFILLQGLMTERKSCDLIKEGDYILRMPEPRRSGGLAADSAKRRSFAESAAEVAPRSGASTMQSVDRLERPSSGGSDVDRLEPPSSRDTDVCAYTDSSTPASTPRTPEGCHGSQHTKAPIQQAHASPRSSPATSSTSYPHPSSTLTTHSIAPLLPEMPSTGTIPPLSATDLPTESPSDNPSRSESGPMPCRYTALQQCTLMVFNMKTLNALIESFEVDIGTSGWICSGDGSKDKNWSRASMVIKSGDFMIMSSDNLQFLQLSNCCRVERVSETEAVPWENVRMRLEGFDTSAAIYIEQRNENNGLEKRVVLTLNTVEDSEMLLKALNFYVGARRILHVYAGVDRDAGKTSSCSADAVSSSSKNGLTPTSSSAENPCAPKRLIQDISDAHTQLLCNRKYEVCQYIMSLKPFHLWTLKEMITIVQSVQTTVHYRGQVIFQQDTAVKGFYVLRHGTVKMQHDKNAQEAELRFPGRDDLMMEEDLKFKQQCFVRKVPLGTVEAGGRFGEELAGKLPLKGGAKLEDKGVRELTLATHSYTLIAESTVVLFMIPWQAYQERLEEKRSASALRTLELFDINKQNHEFYAHSRVRYYRSSRFFVDLAKYRHLAPRAYLKAAQSMQKFVDLYNAIMEGSHDAGTQMQSVDVQAAETAANKTNEGLEGICRGAKTGMEQKELNRLIGSMVEEMFDMLDTVRVLYKEQMQKQLFQEQDPPSPIRKSGPDA